MSGTVTLKKYLTIANACVDWEKVIGKIEDGEEKLRRNQSVQKHLSQKVAEYRLPMQQLKIMYNQNSKAKNFTDEEDRFLVCYGHNL